MYTDNELRLSGSRTAAAVAFSNGAPSGYPSGQVLTGVTDSSVDSTNVVDLSAARDIGEGQELYGVFHITTAVAGGTSTQFKIVTASDSALSSDVQVLGDTGAILTANLGLGEKFAVRLSPDIAGKGQRYLGAIYTVVGTNSAGAVVTDIVPHVQDGMKFYASGFSVA